MNFKIFNLALGYLLFHFLFCVHSEAIGKKSHFAEDEDQYFKPSEGRKTNGPTGEIKNLFEIKKTYSIKLPLDQSSSPTCFANSAYYLIQYFHNYSRVKSNQSLSFINILSQGCRNRFFDGGLPFVILHNLKNKQIGLGSSDEIDLDVLYSVDKKIKDLSLCGSSIDVDSCQKVIEEIVPAENRVHRNKTRAIIESMRPFYTVEKHLSEPAGVLLRHSGVPFDQRTSYILNRLLEINKNYGYLLGKVALSPYNVFVFEEDPMFTSVAKNSVRRYRKSLFNIRKEMILEKVNSLFEKVPALPVSLNICVQSEKKTCLGRHSVTLVGTRTFCHGTKKDQKCEPEWNIVNSYGGDFEGWYKAGPLVESFLKFRGHLDYIEPCGVGSEVTAGLHLKYSKCSPYIQGPFPAHYLAKSGDVDLTLEYLTAHAEQFDVLDSYGRTPLDAAISFEQLDVALALVSLGAKTNHPLKNKENLFSVAAKMGHRPLVEFLIDEEVDLELIGSEGGTPLFLAVEGGHFEVTLELLNAGADYNARMKDGATPLFVASDRGHVEIVQALLNAGANTENTKVVKGLNDDLGCCLSVCTAGWSEPTVDQNNSNRWTPLHAAAKKGFSQVVRALLKAHAKKDPVLEGGETPLFLAASGGYLETVKILLEFGANPSKRVIQEATRKGYLEVVKALENSK